MKSKNMRTLLALTVMGMIVVLSASGQILKPAPAPAPPMKPVPIQPVPVIPEPGQPGQTTPPGQIVPPGQTIPPGQTVPPGEPGTSVTNHPPLFLNP